MKKPVLNPTLTLTLHLLAKHIDVFHCLYKGKFWWVWGEPTLWTHHYTTNVFDIRVKLCFMNATFTLYLACA